MGPVWTPFLQSRISPGHPGAVSLWRGLDSGVKQGVQGQDSRVKPGTVWGQLPSTTGRDATRGPDTVLQGSHLDRRLLQQQNTKEL